MNYDLKYDLLNETIIDLFSDRTPAKHKVELQSIDRKLLPDIIQKLDDMFDIELMNFIKEDQPCSIPNIGVFQLRPTAVLLREIRAKYFERYSITKVNQMSREQYIEYRHELNVTLPQYLIDKTISKLDTEMKFNNICDHFSINKSQLPIDK
jgi:hypothetical protein